VTGIEKNAVTGNVVEAGGLSMSFGSTPALRGASLAVRRGEVVAVMGRPSGSGSSSCCASPSRASRSSASRSSPPS